MQNQESSSAEPTCLFTRAALDSTTREEHTILRSLGGRIRSRRVSSTQFNNATATNFDQILAAPYANIFNYLAPLLASEHAQPGLEAHVGDSASYRIEPGGGLNLRGYKIDRRDENGRPMSVAHAQPEAVLRFAANAGWPPGAWQQSLEIVAPNPEVHRHEVPIIHPNMEVAALKCALLSFDETLADAPWNEYRFTRDGWIERVCDDIRDTVLNQSDTINIVCNYSFGLQYQERQIIRELRREFIREAETPFEHVLIASADPGSGFVDIALLLADTDPWTFRLTGMWNGPAFTILAGCGTLRGTCRWQPAVVPNCRWQLHQRSRCRSVIRADSVGDMGTIGDTIAVERHAAYLRAVDYIERASDEVVTEGIRNLTRFPEAEPIVAPGDNSVRYGLERRLRRLFFRQCQTPEGLPFLQDICAGEVKKLPEAVQRESVLRDDTEGRNVTWSAWLQCHRSILDALAGRFGPPGHIYTISSRSQTL